jgi:alpha-tubulin suppressor-like RCC1 family protein
VSGVYAVLGASDHACGQQGGLVQCWGYNAYGQVGNASTTNVATPTTVISASAFQLSVGYDHTCTLYTSGAAACWGYGAYGQLGNGGAQNVLSPTNVAQGNVLYDAIYTGGFATCARASSDHHLYCWGYNASGGLGTGDNTGRVVPTAVSSTAAWSQIGMGAFHTCGIQNDKSLWCWGANARGQLGIGSRVPRVLPTRVGTDTDWTNLYVGHHHVCARKMDGSLWCWGWNHYGQLGTGDAWRAPVKIQ